MANYYSYNAPSNQQQAYSMTNASAYGTPAAAPTNAYSLQPSTPAATFIAQTVQQPHVVKMDQPSQQQAYVTYGHKSSVTGSQAAYNRTAYNSSYNYSSSSHVQQAAANPTAQTNYGSTKTYYQAAAPSSNVSVTTSYYTSGQPSYQKAQPASTGHLYGSSLLSSNGSSSSIKSSSYPTSYNSASSGSSSSYSSYQPYTQSKQPTHQTAAAASSAVVGAAAATAGTTPGGISNYEKALISAASSLYKQQSTGSYSGGSAGGARTGGGGGGGVPQYTKLMPHWKQKRLQQQATRDPNKPIVATEVKAYLYAWLGKFRSRPDYNITSHGPSPYRQTYVCEVIARGFDFVARGAAQNKKDAQTRAAWDFCDWLVTEGKMTKADLPTREPKFEADKNVMPASYKKKDNKEATAEIIKKKAMAGKINFVSGEKLHLSDGSAPKQTGNQGTVSYPSVATQGGPTVLSKPAGPQMPGQQQQGVTVTEEEEDPKKTGPIGEDYVEQTWTDGRVIKYNCKLCECEFNDPCARDLHVRGRRHRMAYKKKVDPNIEVDVKLNPRQKQMMAQKLKYDKRREMMRNHRMQHQQMYMENERMMAEEMRRYEERNFYMYQNEMLRYNEEMEYFRRKGKTPPKHLRKPIAPHFRFFKPPMFGVSTTKSLADLAVNTKHKEIYPSEEELNAVQAAVQHIETALKEVSKIIHDQELAVHTASKQKDSASPQRLLKAVLRIGDLAKGLLVKNNLNVDLALMCNEKPTLQMLKRVADQLPKQLKLAMEAAEGEGKFDMTVNNSDGSITVIITSEPQVGITIHLTATQMRAKEIAREDELKKKEEEEEKKKKEEEAKKTKKTIKKEPGTEEDATPDDEKKEEEAKKGTDDDAVTKPDPPDILSYEKCCRILAELRHAKWFQAKVNGLQSAVIVTRIMKDLCAREAAWKPVSGWAVELLVEKCIASCAMPLSPSAGLLRVFEAVSSGIFLDDGPGINDPCERVKTDASAGMSDQEKEDVTSAGQLCLRLMAYRKIHEILGIDEIKDMKAAAMKRPAPGEEEKKGDAKKEEPPNKIQKGTTA